MRRADLAAVAAIEREVHRPLPPEGAMVFADRLARFPAGCLVIGRPVAGYAVSHPWRGAAPALGERIAALPPLSDHLLIHDVALRPVLRGHGLAGALLDRLRTIAAAHGLAELRLTAVHGSAAFWARYGFVAAADPAGPSYGPDATPMRRSLLPLR